MASKGPAAVLKEPVKKKNYDPGFSFKENKIALK